jgi:HAD superfamily phosphoserine phosphatase-like hydrolase
VSASADLWLKDWCTQEGIADLLATQLEVVNGVLTGNLASANCRGPEKVRRIQELLDIRDYERIFAYGDSSGDQEMLALAHEAWYRGKRIR